jgi:hypothetical protein
MQKASPRSTLLPSPREDAVREAGDILGADVTAPRPRGRSPVVTRRQVAAGWPCQFIFEPSLLAAQAQCCQPVTHGRFADLEVFG